ncbi:DUF805 domain-containing protein [Pseudomonas sp. GD03944]|uniref:DUF805 domain-containing protein n=1 Tax=Pseudomonas sp. GD03944 TaxID=2975409 RepID=UPI00244BD278|nr:DUF805 domain-containing protein [Pseudomonas sp. GD03944]MDH1263794.1 DUF805 domain-containing protein [Pseudomonas sp. GD03944]
MSCWEHLGIEPTNDQNAIRNAYRARLPDVHPERDPEGFQALRGAYENALSQARGESPTVSEQAALPSASEQAIQQFVDLLQNPSQRFRPEAWQAYCRVLDQLPLEVLESIDGALRHLLLSNGPLSHRCVLLLTERMAWANRLMQLPFEEAEALDHLLQRIAEPDPFDLASLSGLPAVAQVESLWYVRTLEHVFRNRPLQEFRGLSSVHLCLPMPADPAYYPHLYRQCTLAGVALGDALEHYQARHGEAPDDVDTLYLLATQKQLHDQDALDLWSRLWHEHEMPEAAAWLLAWCAHHSPERLPLLILAFNRSQRALGHQHPLDAYQLADGEPAQTPQTLARWQRAADTDLPPLARTFIAWQLGDSEWPFLAELLGAADEPLARAYRQAWLLQRGDEIDLEALPDLHQQGDHPLDALLVQGLRHQARQQLEWLRDSPALQALQQAISTPGAALPEALRDNTVARAQVLRALKRLRLHDDASLQRLDELFAPLPRWLLPPCLQLQLALWRAGRRLPAQPSNPDARWHWQRQTLLLLGLLEQPEQWLQYLGKTLAKLPTDNEHPAHAIKAQLLAADTPWRWMLELDEQDVLQGLIAGELVSPDTLLNPWRLPSAARVEACVQRHGHEMGTDPVGQMLLDAALYHDPALPQALRDEALQRLNGFTCPESWFEPFRKGLIKGRPQNLSQSVCRDNNLKYATMQAIFEAMRELFGGKRPQLPRTALMRQLQDAKDNDTTPQATRLTLAVLLSRCERLLPVPEPSTQRSQWHIWHLGGRLNRRNFTLQSVGLVVAALAPIVLVETLNPNLALGILGVALLVLIGNLLRRLHDMSRGLGTLLMLLAGSFLMPYMLLVLCVWPGDPLPNRYGLPGGTAPPGERDLQAQLRRLNKAKQPTLKLKP